MIDDISSASVSTDSEIRLQITVESLAPENGVGIAQTWFGFHDGSFDLYNTGETASIALENLAEDGITGIEPTIPGLVEEAIVSFGANPADFPAVEETVAGQFAATAGLNGSTQGLIFTDNRTSPFFLLQDPGQTITDTVTIDSDNLENNRFFSFGAMVFPTNDGFIANDNPQEIEIFDEEGNFIGADFSIFGGDVLDAGTEVNDEDPNNVLFDLAVLGNSVDENGTIQPFPGFQAPGEGGVLDFEVDGEQVFANADFTAPDSPIARITVTLVEEDPQEPEESEEPIIPLEDIATFGTLEADILEIFGEDSLVFAGSGDDLIDASLSQGNNRIFGSAGEDTFILGVGDVLVGGDGDDNFFNQSGGENRVFGGAGSDRFVIAAAQIPETALTIADLELDIDTIEIAGIGASTVSDLSFNQDGDNAIISFNETNLAIFNGVAAETLEQNGNFVFV